MEDTNDKQLVTILPFSEVCAEFPEERYPVRLIASRRNVCEHESDREHCDGIDLFYGTEQSDPPGLVCFCPRHWYEQHQSPDAVYRTHDMTAEEHKEALARIARERRDAVARTCELLSAEGHRLSRLGFTEEAGRLYETSGAIRVIARNAPRP